MTAGPGEPDQRIAGRHQSAAAVRSSELRRLAAPGVTEPARSTHPALRAARGWWLGFAPFHTGREDPPPRVRPRGGGVRSYRAAKGSTWTPGGCVRRPPVSESVTR